MNRSITFAWVVGAAFILVGIGNSRGAGAMSSVDEALVKWAKAAAIPTYPEPMSPQDRDRLLTLLADSRLVSLGEAIHGAAEPLEFRNWLFRFLVEELDFNTIGIESGLVDSFHANAFVRGAQGDANTVAARAITFGLGQFPQQASLLQWMQAYNNSDQGHVEFFGIDVSSLPAESNSAMSYALNYLGRVDEENAKHLRARVDPFIQSLKIDRRANEAAHYALLTPAERDLVTATFEDLIAQFEMREADYISRSSEYDYQLAYQAAIATRQTDQYLRQFPVGWSMAKGPVLASVAYADRAKTANIQWLLQRRRDSRVMLFAHDGHAALTPVTVQLGPDNSLPLPPMFGRYLGRRFKQELITFGHLTGAVVTSCENAEDVRSSAPPGSIEALLSNVRYQAFTLDMRGAPGAVRRRLAEPQALFGTLPPHVLNIGDGFNLLYFTQTSTMNGPCDNAGAG